MNHATPEFREYNVTVEIKEEGGLFVANCMELDVSSFGETFEEAKEMIEDAMRSFLETAPTDEIERRISAYRKLGRNVYTTQLQVPVAA